MNLMVAKREKGQGFAEYAVILILVAMVVIVALALMGPTIGNMYSSINSAFP